MHQEYDLEKEAKGSLFRIISFSVFFTIISIGLLIYLWVFLVQGKISWWVYTIPLIFIGPIWIYFDYINFLKLVRIYQGTKLIIDQQGIHFQKNEIVRLIDWQEITDLKTPIIDRAYFSENQIDDRKYQWLRIYAQNELRIEIPLYSTSYFEFSLRNNVEIILSLLRSEIIKRANLKQKGVGFSSTHYTKMD